jgi:hypothetical protein
MIKNYNYSMLNAALNLAAKTYPHQPLSSTLRAVLRHLARQQRWEHPEGKLGKGMKFFPSGKDLEVMRSVRPPTSKYPWSYNRACRALEHCARLEGIHDGDGLRVVKALSRALRCVQKNRPLSPNSINELRQSQIFASCWEAAGLP